MRRQTLLIFLFQRRRNRAEREKNEYSFVLSLRTGRWSFKKRNSDRFLADGNGSLLLEQNLRRPPSDPTRSTGEQDYTTTGHLLLPSRTHHHRPPLFLPNNRQRELNSVQELKLRWTRKKKLVLAAVSGQEYNNYKLLRRTHEQDGTQILLGRLPSREPTSTTLDLVITIWSVRTTCLRLWYQLLGIDRDRFTHTLITLSHTHARTRDITWFGLNWPTSMGKLGFLCIQVLKAKSYNYMDIYRGKIRATLDT
jgi:hypothetical protein